MDQLNLTNLDPNETRLVLLMITAVYVQRQSLNTGKLFIIVPYRNDAVGHRAQQLAQFKDFVRKSFPSNTKLLVIEQGNSAPFNRGLLLNIGVSLLPKDTKATDLVCFHDVDLIPQSVLDYITELKPGTVRHIASNFGRYKGLADYLGGILLMTYGDFVKINGFPNNYWGWGGEDDELRNRINRAKLKKEPGTTTITDLENLPDWKQKKDILDNTVGRLKGDEKARLKKWYLNNPNVEGLSTIDYKVLARSDTTIVDFQVPGPKVAMLFLSISDLSYPKIWEKYLQNEYTSVFTHFKNIKDVKVKWFKQTAIPNVRTQWGHLTNAYLALVREAMKDPRNEWFQFVSDSCLPARPFEEYYNFLKTAGTGQSFIHQMPRNPVNIDKTRNPQAKKYIKNAKFSWIKHSGWFCLHRTHAQQLLSVPNIKLFNEIPAGDEHILSTIYNPRTFTDKVITWVDWDFTEREVQKLTDKKEKLLAQGVPRDAPEIQAIREEKWRVGSHPRTYTSPSAANLPEIKASGAFFFRKVPLPNPVL